MGVHTTKTSEQYIARMIQILSYVYITGTLNLRYATNYVSISRYQPAY